MTSMDVVTDKHIIINLVKNITEKEEKLLKEETGNLADENQILQAKFGMFIYKNHFFQSNVLGLYDTIPLHESLIDKANAHVIKLEKFEFHKNKIRNALGILTNKCVTKQDYRDALPDNLLPKLTETTISSLSRTRDEAYTIAGSVMHLKQWKEVKKLIDYYLVMSVLL